MIKTTLKTLSILALSLFGTQGANAQCAAGEIELEIIVETDQYGHEGYWSLTKDNSNCGINEIASGGNSAVGCNGGGLKTITGGGYGNHQTFSAGKWCVKLDSTFSLHYIDDWGDGGFGFTVLANGYEVLAEDGKSANQTYSFIAQEPPARDAALTTIINPFSYNLSGNTNVKATFTNRGKDTVNTLDVHYALNGGNVESTTLSNLSVSYKNKHTFVHPTALNLSNGQHSLKVWTGVINGGQDSIPTNDTMIYNFEVGPGTPNYISQYIGATVIPQEIGSISSGINKPTDLDFHPVLSKKELWVINKRTENQGGSTVTFSNAGESNQTSLNRTDGNAWHFMSLPTALAFGENENFGTAPGAYDSNHNGGAPFTGPSLWSSDPNIYALPSGGNGSHLDMLHSSPKCQGIAHEKENAYWVFDGYNNDIVMYDFKEDHGPGADYHGDAVVHRYRDYAVAKDPNEKISSHMVLDKATGWLYVVDNGNKRVMRLDINSGTLGANSNINYYEPVAEYKEVNGYTWETVVSTGLDQPSGIDIVGDRMIVSDYGTGDIIIYNISVMPAARAGKITTSAAGIMGVKVGPEGRIWYVDYDGNKVVKLNVDRLSTEEDSKIDFSLYPNPSKGSFNIRFTETTSVDIEIVNVVGQVVYKDNYNTRNINLDLNLVAGTYFAVIKDLKSGVSSTEKIIIQ